MKALKICLVFLCLMLFGCASVSSYRPQAKVAALSLSYSVRVAEDICKAEAKEPTLSDVCTTKALAAKSAILAASSAFDLASNKDALPQDFACSLKKAVDACEDLFKLLGKEPQELKDAVELAKPLAVLCAP